MTQNEYDRLMDILDQRYDDRPIEADNDLRNKNMIINMLDEIIIKRGFKTAEEALSEEIAYWILRKVKDENLAFISKNKSKAYVKINHIADMVEILFDIEIDRDKAGYHLKQYVYCTCGNRANYIDSKEIFKRPRGMIYYCSKCGAYVGVHEGTNIPMGTLVDKETKKKRIAAHEALKRRFGNDTHAAYKWMRKVMKLSAEEAHIGKFNKQQCEMLLAYIWTK